MPVAKAVLTHFLLSAVIVSAILACIFFVWYPSPLFEINGATDILKILVGVDLVLGPLLTAVLYRPGKKGLVFDLSFIALVQLSALIYGTSVFYSERPQFMVFSLDRYTILTEADVTDLPTARSICADNDKLPCTTVVVFDDTMETRALLVKRAMEDNLEPEQMPEFWQPLGASASRVLAKARPLDDIIERAPAYADAVRALQEQHARALSDMVFVPVVNRKLVGFCLIIDAGTAEMLDVIAVDPWEMDQQAASRRD
ncbi:MAG: hypothetical protein AAAFM81_10385 [Pseudomonadota bacterium]